jgi:mono/diheme cytochrome c family protein
MVQKRLSHPVGPLPSTFNAVNVATMLPTFLMAGFGASLHGETVAGKFYRIVDGKVDARTNNGYRLYHGSCNHCHGPDGMGSKFAASLVDNYPMSKPSGALFATARSATFQP